ncbi:hypothetical protein BPAE_0070g00090 [Botrytis paeoniae]|uniref:Uncharacterized protein n=1 Tax=Botrytis paeoniae TaxID=278948 RepID=A0A4Z1FSG1_9HELO|nr:hypothetical protein BPAE_0070g00090 [Botrytis paeoniae]
MLKDSLNFFSWPYHNNSLAGAGSGGFSEQEVCVESDNVITGGIRGSSSGTESFNNIKYFSDTNQASNPTIDTLPGNG